MRQNDPDMLMPVDPQNGQPGRRRPHCALTFPLRLRCASVSDLLTSNELEDAVAHAVGRAFSRARRELPAADVLGSGVVLQSPQLVNGKLAPNEEAALLGRLRRAIERAAQSQALPLRTAAEAGTPLAAPLSARSIARVKLGPNELAAEEFDDDRWVPDEKDPARDTYLIPTYQGRGQPVAVPIKGGTDTTPQLVQEQWRLRTFTSLDDLADDIALHYDGHPPPFVVVVFENYSQPVAWLCQMDPATGLLLRWGSIGTWTDFNLQSGNAEVTTRNLYFYKADLLAFVLDATTQEKVRTIRLEQVETYLRSQPGGGTAKPLAIERQAAALVERMRKPKLPVRYYSLRYGSEQLRLVELSLMEQDLMALPARDLPVCVLSEQIPVTTRDEDETPGILPLDEIGPFWEPDPDKPFLAEPPVDFWPPDTSALLTDLIADLAGRLSMARGLYPGMFALAASNRIRTLAVSYGHLVGNGQSDATPRSLELANLVGAIEPLEKLANYYGTLIDGYGKGLPRPLRGNTAEWLLHFREKYYDYLYAAIGSLFVGSCQDILLANLEKSKYELERRKANFSAYMTVTRSLILLMLSNQHELTTLRSILVGLERDKVVTAVATGAAGTMALSGIAEIDAWRDASRLMLTAFGKVDAGPIAPSGPGRTRTIKDGTVQVQDSMGRWWSRAELDAALATNRKEALAIDPLLEKLSDIPDVVTRLRGGGASGVDDEFARLIDELLDTNAEKTRDARADPGIAFGLAKFKDTDYRETEYGAKLSGIHQLADDFLKPLFPGNLVHAYIAGVGYLAGVEIGKEQFEEFFNLVGLVAIAIFCPELAFVIGAAEAVHALQEAEEHVEIQRALLGGDEIISRAEAEAELWGAAIGAALAFIPEVGSIGRSAVGAGRAIVKGEAHAAAVNAGRRMARQLATHIAETAAKGVVRTFVAECLKGYVLNLAISGAIGRFTAAVKREVEATGDARIADIPQLVGDAFAEASGGGT
jgi:hypothetical protein